MASSLLVVDLGNTNIVLGIYRGSELVSSWRLATARERTADEYGILARQLVGDALHSSIEGAIVASVVPPLNSAMTFMIRKYFGIEPLFVEPENGTEVTRKDGRDRERHDRQLRNRAREHRRRVDAFSCRR